MPKFTPLHILTDQQGISLDTLATQLKLPVSQVAFWMIGLARVPDELVAKVAAVLDVSPSAVRVYSHSVGSGQRPAV